MQNEKSLEKYYLELLRRGYRVSIGKVGELEIDFMSEKGDDRVYYQVAASVMEPSTFLREITLFKKINDHYPKFIITRRGLGYAFGI